MKPTRTLFLPLGLIAALAGAAAPVRAAGGHYAVDDAAILDAGQCQVESWWGREGGTGSRAWHLGPACRVGAVEVGLNLDRLRLGDGRGSTTIAGPQLKWASELTAKLSIGLVAAANWQHQTPRYLGSTLVVPMSWQVSDQWLAHLNVGRDFSPGPGDSRRAGVALEWSPQAAWSVIGERFREAGVSRWRLGGRWNLTPTISLDLSRASGSGAASTSWWTLGVNVQWTRLAR